MIGRTLGGATVATMQGIIVFVIALLAGFRPYHWGLVPAGVLVMILVAVLFTAMRIAVSSLLEDMQGFQLIMNFLLMPIFFLSGALFPLEGLPKAIAVITRIYPLSYSVDALRALLINTAYFELALHLAVLGVGALVFLSGGGYLFSKIQI
jgi:ABC-2 type transport system permease protein